MQSRFRLQLTPMSPSPNRFSQPPQPSSPQDPSEEQDLNASASEKAADDDATTPPTQVDSANSGGASPLLQRPLMRPVPRPTPEPPAAKPETSMAAKPAAAVNSTKIGETVVEPTAVVQVPEAVAEQPFGLRNQPIPPPSEPMQYRAIGLIRGRYIPSEEQFTRGTMIAADGAEIEAVLLGRVMSLVKNHLDLTQEHLWVVYPRTREKNNDLHAQIVGVWEPEKLSKSEEAGSDSEEVVDVPSSEVEADYFSIRGEILFYSQEHHELVVKIQQAPRKDSDRAKAFKLNLKGSITGKTVGYFWDLQVQRQATSLVVRDSKMVAMIPPKKRDKMAGEKGSFAPKKPWDARKGSFKAAGSGSSRPPTPSPRREPLPKPVKRTEQATEQAGEGS